ncbi:MAG TPA: DUF1275 family protein, partial [Tepidisphaeraceae bacterium]|nr:DUF1275 family protein [Tepidisphaeraceae bacterium]
MLVARAYTLRQQSRLAISLSWIAGFTNVVTLAWTGMMVSHVTGNLTHFGQLVVDLHWRAAGLCIFLPVCFMLGAMLSALSIQIARRLHRRSIYILPMSLQALLLAGLSALISIVNWHQLDDGSITISNPTLLGMLALGSLAM